MIIPPALVSSNGRRPTRSRRKVATRMKEALVTPTATVTPSVFVFVLMPAFSNTRGLYSTTESIPEACWKNCNPSAARTIRRMVGVGVISSSLQTPSPWLRFGTGTTSSFDLFWAVRSLMEDPLSVPEPALHDKPPGRLRHGHHPGGEEHRRNGAGAEHHPPVEVIREAGESKVGDVPEHDSNVDEYLREGGEEPTDLGRRYLGGVHRRNHECIADPDAGHEPPNHQEGVVGGEAHQQGPDEEDHGREHDREPPSDPVGGLPGDCRADQRVIFDEDHGSAHDPDPRRIDVMEASKAQAKAYLFFLGFCGAAMAWTDASEAAFHWAFSSPIMARRILENSVSEGFFLPSTSFPLLLCRAPAPPPSLCPLALASSSSLSSSPQLGQANSGSRHSHAPLCQCWACLCPPHPRREREKDGGRVGSERTEEAADSNLVRPGLPSLSPSVCPHLPLSSLSTLCIVFFDRKDFPLRASAHVSGAISPAFALWAGRCSSIKEMAWPALVARK
ncbi:unnamed protein product [Spirodela intermedia]|uniref:Uncharacterized protein n=1 Tax=Spirodela intermedia TaxID=51605 RepID=A0A7I8IKA2_SPIIN|nr:unnamed protein product [Spirodela intermedia]CAA6657568.1 unnamed protein product [Spirodela intermedia]